MFNSSAHTVISQGTFNYLNHGNQYITYNTYPESGAQTQFSLENRWKIELYREYKRVSKGESNLLRTICETLAGQMKYDRQLQSPREYSETKRVFSVARLGFSRDGSQFLSVSYNGVDAKKVFKEDCISFFQIKHARFAQLHAFNDSENPMIFFHDELIPLALVIQRHTQIRPTLVRYIHFQLTMISDHSVPLDFRQWSKNWIRLRDGALVFGPEGPRPDIKGFVDFGAARRHFTPPPLSLDLYNDQCLLNYLADNLMDGLYCPRGHPSIPIDIGPYLSSDIGRAVFLPTRYDVMCRPRQPDIIAQFPVVASHSQWNWGLSSLHIDRYNQVLMADGRIRLEIASWPRYNGGYWFDLKLDKSCSQKRSCMWLAQALHVFKKLNIPRKCWGDYGFLNCIQVRFRPVLCTSQEKFFSGRACNVQGCYLFVFPIPRLSCGFPDISSLTSGDNRGCYWSLDRHGGTVMTEKERATRGLPHFIPEFKAEIMRWAPENYDFIQELQAIKCIDSTTTDFVRLARISLLEIVESRFSDTSNEMDSNPNTSLGNHDGDPMDVDTPSGVGIEDRTQEGGNMSSIGDMGVNTNMDMGPEGHSLPAGTFAHYVGMAVDD